MLFRINKSAVSLDTDKQGLTAEVKDVGLQHGEWPEFIALVNGAVEEFIFSNPTGMCYCGAFVGAQYTTACGFKLTIFK